MNRDLDVLSLPDQIVKRNGAYVQFDLSRVERAVRLCYSALSEKPATQLGKIVEQVAKTVAHKFQDDIPTVEAVQDIVETTLLVNGEFDAAKHYILYREAHAKNRITIPDHVQQAFEADKRYFATPLQQFMFYDKYSRYNWELGRRETWSETVDRVVSYLAKLSDGALGSHVYERIHSAILNMRVMPSMRLLATAGPAAEINSMNIYNCSHLPVKDIDAFAEAVLISMGGCGVGYSVERENVEQFPRIQRQRNEAPTTYVIEDTTEGWGNAVKHGLERWWTGGDVIFDYSQIRKAGAVLMTKGGRASGPEPLKKVLDFLRQKILSRQGTFLRTIDAHDMMCVAGGAAVSGGVRRTAMISIFDYDDTEMRTCKDGAKLDQNQHRWNANNSAVWPEGISMIELVNQFSEMYENRRGEPGIFSRVNAVRTKPERRKESRFGPNPCGEIDLAEFQFCNLSIAVARPEDSFEDLMEKVEIATIIGTIQSMATTFPGMRPEWKQNCEEERLLGVDISGQQDCPIFSAADKHTENLLEQLKQHALAVNIEYAAQLGINRSAAVTCNKPNGNSSRFLNCSPGIHRRWAEYMIMNIRISPHTPIYRVLRDSGVPMDPENGQNERNATSWVVHFPVKAPEGALTRKGYSAIDQCNYWLMNKLHWTEHNPSVTITYQPNELVDLMKWVWEHREVVGGMAFLPADDAQYEQMPYEEITKEEYEKLAAAFPPIDFSLLYAYEKDDMTEAAQEVACSAGSCEI